METKYGMVTLMNGVEYAVKLNADWQKSDRKDWFVCSRADRDEPFLLNPEGILFIEETTEEKFNKWLERQKLLVQLQEKKLAEMVTPKPEVLEKL